MSIASGVAKSVAFKKETTWGVAAGAAGAKYTRRVTSDLSLDKPFFESNEIRTDYQDSDARHGVRSVKGGINGELSVGTYQDFMGTALRRLFTASSDITGMSITIASLGGGVYTVSRAAGDWLAAGGPKVGMVTRLTAGSFNAANLNKNLFILAATTLALTVVPLNGVAMVAEGPIGSATLSMPGKKTYAPLTGHIDESYSIEHWHADVLQSELFLGCKVQSMDIGLPPTGMATCNIDFMGGNVQTQQTQYFTTPTAAGTGAVISSVNGALTIGGVLIGLITGMTMKIDANQTAQAVVGQLSYPDIQEGRIRVSGQATVMFQDAVMRDYFYNETEVSLAMAFAGGSLAADEFITFTMPRVKFGGSAKDDGEKALIQTMPYRALLPKTGGVGVNCEQSTLAIQDSLAV